MREYWKLAIEPHWPRIRPLHEADVTYRARQLALGGAELLFADLHPMLDWQDGALVIDKQFYEDRRPRRQGPPADPRACSTGPASRSCSEAEQPDAVLLPPRHRHAVGRRRRPQRTGAMDDLIGGTRADILRVLEVPMTTGELARRLHLTPAAVSQQLGVLRRAGVVDARRQGREVYSELTSDGRKLLDLLG